MRPECQRKISESDFRKYFDVEEEIFQTSWHSIKRGWRFIARKGVKKSYHFTQTGCIEEFNGFLQLDE